MKKLILFFVAVSLGTAVYAQTSVVRGVVLDAKTGEVLQKVNVRSSQKGLNTITDVEGNFELQVDEYPIELYFSCIGYGDARMKVARETESEIKINMISKDVYLDEIEVFADVASERKNPIALKSIGSDIISSQLGDNPFPLIMDRTPGVYSSRDGGGSGDASLSIRGFQQKNIAVLVNGVPINGAESGSMYWNNWIGLTEATGSIQVQRGIGASKVALNSVGGTVNIITHQAGQEKGGFLSVSTTSYGNQKYTLFYNTGETAKGWNVSLLGSRNIGKGYVDATHVDGWSYFLNVAKNIGQKHRLVFTVFGGPERHGQRTTELTQNEIDKYGIKYNKDWGSYNGLTKNTAENFYHKPHFALNHYWNIDETAFLSTSVYYSPGYGGGVWNDRFQDSQRLTSFRNASGQIDWDAVYDYNSNHTDTYSLENGAVVNDFSKVVLTNYIANHQWAGVLSSIEKNITPTTKFIAGLHYRFFQSSTYQTIEDLLGGDFYIDDYSSSLVGIAGRNQIKYIGDKVKINNGALLHHGSFFAQLEKEIGKFNFFVGGTVSENMNRRFDEYNYPGNKWSEWVNVFGYDFKGGVNFNIDEKQNVYVNGGHFNKAPSYKIIFGNSSNIPVANFENEKVNTVELGYTLRHKKSFVSASAYYTMWRNVSMLSNPYIQIDTEVKTRSMITGLNSLHKGFELEAGTSFCDWLSVGAAVSIGDWEWKNDVEATIFNDNNLPVDTVRVFADGLKVGSQPQFQTMAFVNFKILKTFNLEANMNYYDKHYADFEPSGRQNENDRSQAYRLPSATVFDIHLSFEQRIGKQRLTVYANCNNLFDQIYILKGEDGDTHDINSFIGYWSFGRTVDIGLRLNF